MIPVLVLAVIAVVFIRSLMHVVARDEATGLAGTSDFAPVQSYDPTMQPRATVNDGARSFLLPAAPEAEVAVDLTDALNRASQRS